MKGRASEVLSRARKKPSRVAWKETREAIILASDALEIYISNSDVNGFHRAIEWENGRVKCLQGIQQRRKIKAPTVVRKVSRDSLGGEGECKENSSLTSSFRFLVYSGLDIASTSEPCSTYDFSKTQTRDWIDTNFEESEISVSAYIR